MERKQEVVIDTDFFGKISKIGCNGEKLKRIVEELGYTLVVHPYINARELDINTHYVRLKNEGYIRVPAYDEFLKETDRALYEYYFHILYQELMNEELEIPRGTNIFDCKRAGKSFGEIHSVLMAVFMKIPVFLSDDSDAVYVGERVQTLFNNSQYSLQVYNIVAALTMIAKKKDSSISKAELIELAKQTGHAKAKSLIKQVWNENHG